MLYVINISALSAPACGAEQQRSDASSRSGQTGVIGAALTRPTASLLSRSAPGRREPILTAGIWGARQLPRRTLPSSRRLRPRHRRGPAMSTTPPCLRCSPLPQPSPLRLPASTTTSSSHPSLPKPERRLWPHWLPSTAREARHSASSRLETRPLSGPQLDQATRCRKPPRTRHH